MATWQHTNWCNAVGFKEHSVIFSWLCRMDSRLLT